MASRPASVPAEPRLAGYLARARGVRASPGRIVVCSGFTQGLALLSQVLRARGGSTLAVEEYSLPSLRATAGAAGLNLIPLPVDGRGAAVRAAGAADAILCTPAHQFPLGAALAPQRRAVAVDWARPPGAWSSRTTTTASSATTVSRSAPCRRSPPSTWSTGAQPARASPRRSGSAGWCCPLISSTTWPRPGNWPTGWAARPDQLTLAEFIVCGGYDRHIRRARLAYRRRRDRLVDALRREAPQVRVTGIAAGLDVLCELPPGPGPAAAAEQDVVARAAAHGLAVAPLAPYRVAGQHDRPALIVGYSTPPEHAFSGAVARLCAVLRGAA